MLYFRILSQDMNCVAAIGVVHFSVRGFGCALFYFGKEYENMKVRKFLAIAALFFFERSLLRYRVGYLCPALCTA